MNARKHGGQAAQAIRRGESWIQCTDCTTHSRRVQASPQPTETPADFAKALAVALLLVAALVSLVIAGVGYFPVEVAG